MLIDRCLIPFHAIAISFHIWRKESDIVLTVAHGYLFLAATLAATIMRRPLFVIVHDDWVAMEQYIRIFRHCLRPLYHAALNRATVVFAVSDIMAANLWDSYGIRAEVQWPATFKAPTSLLTVRPTKERTRIAFAGMMYGTVHESLDHLVRFIHTSDDDSLELYLYSNYEPTDFTKHGWVHPRIHSAGWISQEVLQQTLRQADILFVPVSYKQSSRYYALTSFPSKVADYLAVERPILLLAPQDAAITLYARRYGFADIVTEPTQECIGAAVARLRTDIPFADSLVAAGRRVFTANHDMSRQQTEVFARFRASVLTSSQ